MKLRVLVDNNTYIDQYYGGEPALSYYIEDGDARILFDTGYSDLFIHNAKAMNIMLANINTIVISHGHNDHTRGLSYLLDTYDLSNVTLIAHPDAFMDRHCDGLSIGSPVSIQTLTKQCKLQLSKEPIPISQNLYFLGEIPQYNDFETRHVIGKCISKAGINDDYVMDDSALVYKTIQGIYIITGCSHSGICNIIEHAKKLTGDHRVLGVLGGFHLFEEDKRLQKTIAYFIDNNIQQLYPCHCVSFYAKAAIHKAITIQEVGVGLSIDW